MILRRKGTSQEEKGHTKQLVDIDGKTMPPHHGSGLSAKVGKGAGVKDSEKLTCNLKFGGEKSVETRSRFRQRKRQELVRFAVAITEKE